MIIKAELTDHTVLSIITKASKAYWGYSHQQMELWDEELTITHGYIKQNIVYKYLQNEIPVAYYSMIKQSEKVIKMDNLFVLPDWIGKGIGKIMLDHSLVDAKENRYEEMVLDADPNAYLFYEKYGFEIIGKKKTSIKDRYMPSMRKKLLKC